MCLRGKHLVYFFLVICFLTTLGAGALALGALAAAFAGALAADFTGAFALVTSLGLGAMLMTLSGLAITFLLPANLTCK